MLVCQSFLFVTMNLDREVVPMLYYADVRKRITTLIHNVSRPFRHHCALYWVEENNSQQNQKPYQPGFFYQSHSSNVPPFRKNGNAESQTGIAFFDQI